jgi:hypothetical protein
VEKSIELVGVNSKIVRFCKLSMEKWNTRLFYKKTKQKIMQSQPIQIRRGIFQGDFIHWFGHVCVPFVCGFNA